MIEEQKKGPGIRDLRGQIMKFLPLLLILLWPAAQAPAKEREMKKNESVSDFAQYAVPQSWTIAEGTNQGDPQAALTREDMLMWTKSGSANLPCWFYRILAGTFRRLAQLLPWP